MRAFRLTCLWMFLLPGFLALRAQEPTPVDSLRTLVVTATLNPSNPEVVPARVALVGREEITGTAVTNTDELLANIPGVFVNRSWGIFSKNSAVTMRGLSGSARVLVLLDGIPLNRSGGGGINWHLIGPEQLSHIEVLSGPASSLYGQNAMGGVIQLFPLKPGDTLSLRAGVDYGSCNTASGSFSAGKANAAGKGWWSFRAFYRSGDGYLLVPEDLQSEYDTKAYLKEGNFHLSGGMEIKPGHEASFTWILQKDKRGSGIRVFEPDGAYESYFTNLFSLRFKGRISQRTGYSAGIYNQSEKLSGVDEKVNSQGLYKLLDAETGMNDIGILMHVTHHRGKHLFTGGGDLRSGSLASLDVYRTSTDVLEAGGSMHVAGFFLQDEISLLPEKLFVIAGLRLDMAAFRDGYLKVTDPTKETGFTEGLANSFANNNWHALSPKLALRYRFNPVAGVYISAGRGFSAPKLNDLTSSGKIRKGFKLANPGLGPEVLDNIEAGANITLAGGLTLTPSLFMAKAKSLQYQVATGDSTDVAGELKPVLQVRNVAGVKIYGGELRLEWQMTRSLLLFGGYSHTVSLLSTAGAVDSLVSRLDGKDLSEVPQHLASGGLLLKRAKWFGKIDWNYTSSLWYDDENTIQTGPFHIFNLKAGCQLAPAWLVTLTIQDLADNVHTDKKGLLSPGRFIMAGVRFQIGPAA